MSRATHARQTPFDTDVMIVGGGMVGGVLARALAADGWNVEVIDPRPPGQSGSFDRRLTAVADAGWQYLDALGLVDAPLAAAAECIREVRVFDRGHFGLTRITARSAGVEALGYVMPNRALGERLEALREHPPAQAGRVTYRRPARYTHHQSDADGVTVSLVEGGDEQRITRRARLVVAADGADSRVRAGCHRGDRHAGTAAWGRCLRVFHHRWPAGRAAGGRWSGLPGLGGTARGGRAARRSG